MSGKMEKKILRLVKMVSILCIVVLILELGYLIYKKYFNVGESIYFDSINAISFVDNNYIAVGSNNNNENYYEKAKISFYNNRYEKKYERIFNKGYNGAFFGVDVLDDGAVAVGSYEANLEEHESAVRSALIVRYDEVGNVIFDREFQILGNSKFVAVKCVNDGYLVVGQSVYDKMTIGFSSEGGAFLVKYDKDGNLLWKSNFGGSKSAIFNDLYVSDNYVYVVGVDSDMIGLIAKYNFDGELVKVTEYEYTDSFGFTSITATDDELVVSGGKRIITDNNSSWIDAVIVKYDFDCNYLDEVSYDDGSSERFNQITVDENGDLVVIGSLASFDEDKNTKEVNVLRYDGIIAKYKSNLKLLKSVSYGEERDDHFTDILVVGDKYLVSGYSSYEDDSYMSKFIVYSDALKLLEVR